MHDLGELWAGDPPSLVHRFKVTNVSTQVVYADLICYSCSGDPIYRFEPGQTCDVPLSLRTVMLRGAFTKVAQLRVVRMEPAE